MLCSFLNNRVSGNNLMFSRCPPQVPQVEWTWLTVCIYKETCRDMWVHFNHVHCVDGQPTMLTHVYDPFAQEHLTLAICKFNAENKHAQIEFWRILNMVFMDQGFQKPKFRGLMANEANSNWIVVCTIYTFQMLRNKCQKRKGYMFSIESRVWCATLCNVRQMTTMPSSFQHRLKCGKLTQWRSKLTQDILERIALVRSM